MTVVSIGTMNESHIHITNATNIFKIIFISLVVSSKVLQILLYFFISY